MAGLIDFDERKPQPAAEALEPQRVSWGGRGSRSRACLPRSAALQRPLGLPRRQEWSGAGDPPSCSCHGATCECQESAAGKRSSTRPSQTKRETRSRIMARPMHGDVGGLLGRPPPTSDPSRLVALRQPIRKVYSHNHGLKDEGNFLSGHSVPSGAELVSAHCGPKLRSRSSCLPESSARHRQGGVFQGLAAMQKHGLACNICSRNLGTRRHWRLRSEEVRGGGRGHREASGPTLQTCRARD